MVLEKTRESPLDCKEIQPVNPKGNQSWTFIGRTDAEAETPILWPPDVKNWLIGKNPWCWERLKAGGERDDRGWDGWMASTTQWTWIRASSGSWWWTVKPGDAAAYAVTRVWHDWRTGLNWTVSVAVPLLTGTGFWELIVPLKWAMVEYLHDGNWQALQISLPAYH